MGDTQQEFENVGDWSCVHTAPRRRVQPLQKNIEKPDVLPMGTECANHHPDRRKPRPDSGGRSAFTRQLGKGFVVSRCQNYTCVSLWTLLSVSTHSPVVGGMRKKAYWGQKHLSLPSYIILTNNFMVCDHRVAGHLMLINGAGINKHKWLVEGDLSYCAKCVSPFFPGSLSENQKCGLPKTSTSKFP